MSCQKRDCFYFGTRTGTCDYYLIEKVSKGCTADNCNKYRPAESAREKTDSRIPQRVYLTREQASIARLRFSLGDSDVEVAQRLGVSLGAVRKWQEYDRVEEDFRKILRGEEDQWAYVRIK